MNLDLPKSALLRQQFRDNSYAVAPCALPHEMVERWRHDAERLSCHARSIQRTEGNFQLTYRVVTGDHIREYWPELFAFYCGPAVHDWVQYVTGEDAISTSANLRSAVNLNIMDQVDSVYRWHFDAEPYTVLLYLTGVQAEDGGALEIIPNCSRHQVPSDHASPIRLFPPAGTLLVMDGTRCYHRATAMLRPVVRFSVPMVFPKLENANDRPAGLDSYLYEASD